MKHDAILKKVMHLVVGRSAIGDIYEDSKGRFSDGSHVRTSTVKEIVEKDGKTFIVTRNTIYLHGDK